MISLSKESESINKWNLGGQIYLDFIRLNQKAQTLFDFTEEQNEQVNKKNICLILITVKPGLFQILNSMKS